VSEGGVGTGVRERAGEESERAGDEREYGAGAGCRAGEEGARDTSNVMGNKEAGGKFLKSPPFFFFWGERGEST